MQSKTTILSFWLCFSLTIAYGQNEDWNILEIPENLLENAHTVYRLMDIHFSMEDNGNATLNERSVVTLLNDKSRKNIQYVFYDNSSKIKDFDAELLGADGTSIRKIKKSEIKDQSAISSGTIYSDSRIKIVEINHGAYPYTIKVRDQEAKKGCNDVS